MNICPYCLFSFFLIYLFLDKVNINSYFENKMSQQETVSDTQFNSKYFGMRRGSNCLNSNGKWNQREFNQGES